MLGDRPNGSGKRGKIMRRCSFRLAVGAGIKATAKHTARQRKPKAPLCVDRWLVGSRDTTPQFQT
jgi:hypothetical protein